jgi:hypothetical protein
MQMRTIHANGSKTGTRSKARRPDGEADLRHYEEALQHLDDRRHFYEVGKALEAIRDRRLYRGEFSSFESYCADRWDLARSTAYQMIRAAAVVDNVRDCTQEHTVPDNEAQARPLTKLSPDQQREVWVIVVETAPEGGVTAKHVEAVVAAYLGRNGKPSTRRTRRTETDPSAAKDLGAYLQGACRAARDIYLHLIWYKGLMSPLGSFPTEATYRDWLRAEMIRLEELRHTFGCPANHVRIDPDDLTATFAEVTPFGPNSTAGEVEQSLRTCNQLYVELRLGVRGPTPEGEAAGRTGDISAKVKAWWRKLCRDFHPDRSGSKEVMQALNEAHARLKEALGL